MAGALRVEDEEEFDPHDSVARASGVAPGIVPKGDDIEKSLKTESKTREVTLSSHSADMEAHRGPPPWWVWFILAVAVISSSAGGALFAAIDAPPILKASWRLWATFLVQLPLFCAQCYRSSPKTRGKWLRYSPLIVFVGAVLAAHFGFWSWSIDHTTLARSLLLVSSHPVVLVGLGWFSFLCAGVFCRTCLLRSVATSEASVSGEVVTESKLDGREQVVVRSAPVSPEKEADMVVEDVDEEEFGSGGIVEREEEEEEEGEKTEEFIGGNLVEMEQGEKTEAVVVGIWEEEEEVGPGDLCVLGRPPKGMEWMCLGVYAFDPTPPTIVASVGAWLGFFGAATMVVLSNLDAVVGGAFTSPTSTLAGDAAAFGGALAFVVYLSVGRRVRRWCPLFLYMCPVNLSGAVVAMIASLVLEPVSFVDSGVVIGVEAGNSPATTVFSFLTEISPQNYLPIILVVAMGIVPGTLGHAMSNLSLRYVDPLVVSVVLLLEPITGSLLGLLVGRTTAPDLWTYVGGSILLLGAFVTVIGSERPRKPHHSESELSDENPQKTNDKNPQKTNTFFSDENPRKTNLNRTSTSSSFALKKPAKISPISSPTSSEGRAQNIDNNNNNSDFDIDAPHPTDFPPVESAAITPVHTPPQSVSNNSSSTSVAQRDRAVAKTPPPRDDKDEDDDDAVLEAIANSILFGTAMDTSTPQTYSQAPLSAPLDTLPHPAFAHRHQTPFSSASPPSSTTSAPSPAAMRAFLGVSSAAEAAREGLPESIVQQLAQAERMEAIHAQNQLHPTSTQRVAWDPQHSPARPQPPPRDRSFFV